MGERNGWGRRRLGNVRRRKQARRHFNCQVMAFKMRLVKDKEKGV